MHLTFLRHAGLAAARILMMAAWFGLSVWAAGVVFYNVWGGPVLVWLYVAAMDVRFRPPQKTARIMARFLGSAGPVAGVLPVHTGDER